MQKFYAYKYCLMPFISHWKMTIDNHFFSQNFLDVGPEEQP